MSSDHQLKNIYRYSRQSYGKNRKCVQENACNTKENIMNTETSPRSDGFMVDPPGCSCEADPDGEIASLLHNKCPVITLAQQQLQILLDETDKLLCDNTRCCRSVYDFLCICKEIVLSRSKCQYFLIFMIGFAFFSGLIIGSATCGTYLGRLNSPILKCIDNFFVPDSFQFIQESFRSIV